LELPWRRNVPGITLLLGFLLAGCGGANLTLPGGGGEGGEPAAIRVVTGDGQSGQVGEPLTAPVVVEVTDAEGLPVEGATVAFELISTGEGAEISPATGTTDAAGRAEARVLLGSKVGLQTGEARVIVEGGAVPKTSFSAVATLDAPGNRPPRSDFTWDCEDLVCQFTDASTDEDGSIAGRSWRFGDGGTSEATNPSHTYAGPGSYTVSLTVSDGDGATDESSDQVNVTVPPPQPNEAPQADFDVHCSRLTCTFVDKSKDDDGVIVSWQWSFGDGASSSERNPVHTYGEEGKYNVLLVVTDDRGATDAKVKDADAKER
jgi:PKD repeat protein